jgi:hypothetical protein
VQKLIIPEVGMAFDSEDKAYEMYNSYAGKAGFSIRKSSTKHRTDNTICPKHIVCSNQGFRKNGSSQEQVVMLVFNLVSAKRGFRPCKRLYLITITILLVQINCTS